MIMDLIHSECMKCFWAVFYEGDDIIGGGWIKSSFDQNKVNFKSKHLINND